MGDGLDDLRVSTLLADESLFDLLDGLAVFLVGRTRLVEWRGVVLRETITVHLSQTFFVVSFAKSENIVSDQTSKQGKERKEEGRKKREKKKDRLLKEVVDLVGRSALVKEGRRGARGAFRL